MTKASWAFLIDSVPFSKATRDGLTSLGGSESACVGLMRALAMRHDVTAYVSKLDPDAVGVDAAGVKWLPLQSFVQFNQFVEYDVVVGLRMPQFFAHPINARLRVLWNQDLLVGETGKQVMAVSCALDKSVYVSQYHRAQWEDVQPELKLIGAVTKNGFDAALVPPVGSITKDPNRIIHISRPERGLAPLLQMWPALKAQKPNATIQICRYRSMYDGEGTAVKAICETFDDQVAEVNAEVGGIEYLGSLNKAELYKAISEAAVMWYPGVDWFAETSCIAAIEAQANGTPLVASLKGALPETARPSFEAGLLIPGDAESEVYQAQSIAAVVRMLDGCRTSSVEYRRIQKAGYEHVTSYTYDALAAEWEAMVDGWFTERYESRKLGVLRQLIHEDDHTAAALVATEICQDESADDRATDEAVAAEQLCARVIAGKDHGPDDYAAHAIADPLEEVKYSGRFQYVAPSFVGCRRVLDIACGNGSGAIALALAHPSLSVVGVDYAAENIRSAKDAAERAGVGGRCQFYQAAVWDFDRNAPDPTLAATVKPHGPYDGMFVGEFVEHIADCTALVEWLETFCEPGARVVYTCPIGPFVELLHRGDDPRRAHVHCFKHDDVDRVWGKKQDYAANAFMLGHTPRLSAIGHWVISYRVSTQMAGRRDYKTRIQRTRPMERLSVGLIAKNAETEIGKCLQSVWNIADEIVVGDTGSSDQTARIARTYGARVINLPEIEQIQEGFAGARNAVLDACSGEWFLWIDTDETLIDPHLLRRYTEGPILNGVVLHQQHVYLDAPPSFDIPTRLFRVRSDVQFYGCIHEQPQMGDCNTEIMPALEVDDVLIAHSGYLTADAREQKRVYRNRPLLMRDQRVFPDRELGKVLLMRDVVIQADVERSDGQDERSRQGYQLAADLFIRHFDDPDHKLHKLARPWYEAALKALQVGWEFEWALAGRPGGIGDARAQPSRLWVRDDKELHRVLAFHMRKASERMAPAQAKTDPFVLPQQGVCA